MSEPTDDSLSVLCMRNAFWAADEIRRYRQMHVDICTKVVTLFDALRYDDGPFTLSAEHWDHLKAKIEEHFK